MTDHAGDSGPPAARAESASTEANGPNDRIESRLRAVERAVTGNDARPADVADGATATAERERLESRLDDLEERVAELEAATQAVRGYVGAVRAVNREVERRADLALSRATAAERRSDGGARGRGAGDGGTDNDDPATTSEGDAAETGDRRRDATSTVDGAVPSESALDAALPDDRPSSEGWGGSDGWDGREGSEGGDDGEGGAWAGDALSRLRESL